MRVAERTRELDEALAHERELGEMKSRFVTLVSHEFRTPLGVIMSASDVLQRYFERLPAEKRQRHLDMILRSTRNLASLIEEVLLLGRVEEGHMPFVPAAMDLEKLCRTFADEAHSAGGGACPIVFRPESSLEGAAGDEALLRHILSNLLSNAVKYSEPGTPVEFTARRAGDAAVFTIRDHGIGISAEDQARLFTSFTRGQNVGTRPGTGLGLVVVQRCVKLHGGSLDLASTLGQGTTVTVTLPLFTPPSTTS
jgi:signal transduction histidine kinase